MSDQIALEDLPRDLRAADGLLGFNQAADLVRAHLAEHRRDYVAAAIFGSVAKECNRPNSDIDVLVVDASPALTKRNLLYRERRLQLIEGSMSTIRQRISNVPRSRNDFIVSVVLDGRWVAGEERVIAALKEAAKPIAKAGLAPISYHQYLSIRARCADAVEKLETVTDLNHRMFVGMRIFALLHELAAATSRSSLYMGTSSYPQFLQLAPEFASAMADHLRLAIINDNYAEFAQALRAFFERVGGFAWECDEALPI